MAESMPSWARKEIDSICRKSLWAGRDDSVRGKMYDSRVGYPSYLAPEGSVASYYTSRPSVLPGGPDVLRNDVIQLSFWRIQRKVMLQPRAYGFDGPAGVMNPALAGLTGLPVGAMARGSSALEDPSLAVLSGRAPARALGPSPLKEEPDVVGRSSSLGTGASIPDVERHSSLPNFDGPSEDESNILFVDCLPTDCTRREVAHLFRVFPGFKDIRVVHKEPRRSGDKAYVLCFVEFENAKCARVPMKELQGYCFDDRKPDSPCLKIQFARTHSGTFKDGDLRVNKDGLRIVSQSEGGEASPIEPLDSHLSLDDLDVIKVIGKGSSGNVQLVRHKFTGQFFALKVIQLNIDEKIRKQIAKELKINLSTQCQYVVVFYQCFYFNGVISIVLEYMDVGSLADFLKTVKTIPEAYLAAICKQILKGLIYLHNEKRIIHRDLKPSNILINHRGEVKISDFGVSAIISSSSGQRDTFIGTRNYMAPERIDGKKHGSLSDIWSLGLVILECATGNFPFPPCESFYELLVAVVDQPPPSAPTDQFSPEFCAFISACLQKDANDRSSAQALLKWSARLNHLSYPSLPVVFDAGPSIPEHDGICEFPKQNGTLRLIIRTLSKKGENHPASGNHLLSSQMQDPFEIIVKLPSIGLDDCGTSSTPHRLVLS
ncbi:unnamed protein product [Miscanthus lutarioriparius]|uniref:mitogen-activated protein kinase kinase n=1 Tax=Miscanthus lutarioriparius TaxID=422564 RepID=A0A811SHD9_9POAL|nr:unnamed protein product [Miscanthus lutarioriparius]